MTVAVGSIVGPYRLIAQLGAGGMGAVFVGEHTVLGRTMAIKVLHTELTQHAQIAQRFINEAIAASILKSEHIIKVHDCQQDPSTGIWWIAMEHLQGQSLARYMASQGRELTFEKAIQIACQIAEALDEAHASGIIHRDIKPDNVFLISRDQNTEFVKVLDFGIAKLRREDAGVVTKTYTVIGTQPYMPPEQLRGLPVDNRVDVFALTVVLYAMLSYGYHPFQISETLEQFYQLTSAELCIRQMSQSPSDIRRWNPHIPEAVAQVLASGLHRDPAGRPNSAGDLVVELARAGGALGVVESYSRLLAPNAARRSIQVPVPEAPVTMPPRERATVPLGPRTETEPPIPKATTLGSVASQAYAAKPPRGSLVKFGLIAATLAVAVIVGTAVWFARSKRDAPSESVAAAPGSSIDATTTPPATAPPDANETLAALDATVAPTDASVPVDAAIVVTHDAAVATTSPDKPKAPDKPKQADTAPKSTATGTLSVTTTESNADVYLDGKYLGMTPLTYKATVGPHKVVLVKGTQRETIKVNVTTAKPTVIERPW